METSLPLTLIVMRKNLPALRKRLSVLFFAVAFFTGEAFLFAQSPPPSGNAVRWYRSNSSGVAIEFSPSRLAALRNEYCLSVERVRSGLLPDILVSYYDNDFSIELRMLYEKGEEIRRQWVFRDSRGLVRLTSSGSVGFFERKQPKNTVQNTEQATDIEKTITGFIEIRDKEGTITRELSFDEDLAEWEFLYSYKNEILISAETWYKEPPPKVHKDEEKQLDEAEQVNEVEVAEEFETTEEVMKIDEAPKNETLNTEDNFVRNFVLLYTDYYYYSRPGSLRAIERFISEAAKGRNRIPFPRIGPGSSPAEEIVAPRIAYVPNFLSGVYDSKGERVSYTIDSRGRIITETWKDDEGKVVGEVFNIWDGDRLASISWKAQDQVLLVEYEYDAEGNRMAERNLRQGVLERSVTTRGGREIEEIYVNGRLMLRAIWEKGLKISEERIVSPQEAR